MKNGVGGAGSSYLVIRSLESTQVMQVEEFRLHGSLEYKS